jgi:hypothetical protein
MLAFEEHADEESYGDEPDDGGGYGGGGESGVKLMEDEDPPLDGVTSS